MILVRNFHTVCYGYRQGGIKSSATWSPLAGVNLIKPEAWAEVSTWRTVKKHLDAGLLTVEEVSDDLKLAETLRKYNTGDALAMVSGCFNRDLLANWRITETRRRVIDALDLRLRQSHDDSRGRACQLANDLKYTRSDLVALMDAPKKSPRDVFAYV